MTSGVLRWGLGEVPAITYRYYAVPVARFSYVPFQVPTRGQDFTFVRRNRTPSMRILSNNLKTINRTKAQTATAINSTASQGRGQHPLNRLV